MPLRPGTAACGLLAATGMVTLGLTLGATAPAYAEDVSCLDVQQEAPVGAPATAPSAPLAAMQVGPAQDRVARAGATAGAGSTVAVLGSGIAVTADLPVEARVDLPDVTVQPEVIDPTSTIVAGLIAGPTRADGDDEPGAALVGVAPAARLLDVRLYDAGSAGDDASTTPSARTLRIGLGHIADRPDLGVDVVVVPEAVERDPAEADALVSVAERLQQQGVVVVVAAGDLPAAGEPLADRMLDDDDRPRRGLDAASLLWPAGLPGVVTVNSVEPGALPTSSTSVAAPTLGAVSVALNGQTCLVTTASSAWAAGEVAGLVALLRTAYPDEEPRTTVERMRRTATGSGVASRLTGAGVVQPVEALTRPLAVRGDGGLRLDRTVDDGSDERATRPERPDDVLADARSDAVWWGLIGGGALVVAAVLRPVLARRR